MGLCNIYGYTLNKTVKLSDAYGVTITLKPTDFDLSNNEYAITAAHNENNEIELPECTSVTLPEYKPKEDIFVYGNNSKKFIYMDPASLEDLEIEVIERYHVDEFSGKPVLFMDRLVNLFLSKLFDEKSFGYKLGDYIPKLVVTVYDNTFQETCIQYIFEELKLTGYTKYDLDYSSTDIAKWTLKFSYRSYYVYIPEEQEEPKTQQQPTLTEGGTDGSTPEPVEEPKLEDENEVSNDLLLKLSLNQTLLELQHGDMLSDKGSELGDGSTLLSDNLLGGDDKTQQEILNEFDKESRAIS